MAQYPEYEIQNNPEEYLNRSHDFLHSPYENDLLNQTQNNRNKSFDYGYLDQSQESIQDGGGAKDGNDDEDEDSFLNAMINNDRQQEEALRMKEKRKEEEDQEEAEDEKLSEDPYSHYEKYNLNAKQNQIREPQKLLKRPAQRIKVDELDEAIIPDVNREVNHKQNVIVGREIPEDQEDDHYRRNDLNAVENRLKSRPGRQLKEAVKEVPVLLPREVPAELTWDAVDTAAREYFNVRKIAYLARKKSGKTDANYNPNARWSELSMNQKIKRKRKGSAKQRLRNTAIQFAAAQKLMHGPDAQPVIPHVPNEEEINTFLAINLDAFHVNNDQEFIAHLAENFALTDRIEPMEQLLERVVRGESELAPARVEEISKQIAFLKELKEWMDARLELIQDPYYVLISSRELTDSAEVLEGLKTMEEKKWTLKKGNDDLEENLHNVKAFLTRYERVKKCSFNRRRLRDVQDLTYREEFREQTDAKGVERNRDIVRRMKIREERDTREGWQRTARERVLEVKEARPTVLQEPATVEQFREKSTAFLAIDLKQLHFSSISDILEHHRAHDVLFEQGREMQRILTEVSQEGGSRISDQEFISVRARLALFGELRRRQTKALLELTKQGEDMENMSLEEWIKKHDLVLGLDPATEEKKYLQDFTAQNDEAENRIQEMYAQLKPGQVIPLERIAQVKKDFQRNLLFWESIKAARMELSAQDDETKAFLNSYYRNQNKQMPEISNHLLIHLRGKSKADTEEILRKCAGTPAERMQLEKEMADNALAEVKHLEEFRVNPDNTAGFLQNIAVKLHTSDLLSSAEEAVVQITVLHVDHQDVPVPEGYVDEFRKELMALSEFARDHIGTRMKVMTDVAGQVDTAFLGSVDIREFKSIKEDRDAIRSDLEAPAGEGHAAAKTAARVLFTTADKLFKNAGELEDLVQGEKQRVASADAGLDAVYQTYRLANGIQEKVNELEEAKRQTLVEIDRISENPVYSSREELQALRDRCISALSEYEKNVPEHLYYDLTTPVLKNLAVRKLRDNIDGETIQKEIKRYQEAGIRREKEEEQPEWGEKEKNAILLLGNLAGMEEKKEEDGEDLLSLLDAHAEIIADMARVAMSDEKKKKADMKRYRELKQKIEIGENLKNILEEEKQSLHEMQERYEKASKEEKPDKKYVEYLNSQVVMYQKQVESLQTRLADWNENQSTYRKELRGLAYLDAVQKEIEEKELALQKDYEVFEQLKKKNLRKKVETDILDQDEKLHQKLKEQFRKLDEITEKRRKAQDQEQMDQCDAALEQVAAEIQKLEKSRKDKKEGTGDSEEIVALGKEIQKKEAQLEKLKKGPDVPLDVFGSMSRRLEGLDGDVAREMAANFSGIVDFLVQKSGEKVLKLSSVRRLLKEKDPKLIKLMKETKQKIRTSMEQTYKKVCKEIKDVVPFMFENLNAPQDPFWNETFISESMEIKRRQAYYQHQYDEKDALADWKAEIQIQKNAREELKELNRPIEGKKLGEEEVKELRTRTRAIQKKKKDQLSLIGPEALFMQQSRDLFTMSPFKAPGKEPVTLEMLHNRNWAYDQEMGEQPGEGTFVRNVMRNYFEQADEKDKRSMLKTMFFSLKPMIRDHKHVKTNRLKQTGMHLAGMLRGAGPLLQKLMQGVPQRYLLNELSEAVEDMKSNLEPIPDSYVKEMFEKMKADSKGQITEIKKLQSLGAASVGQTFLCRVKGTKYPNGKQVVIKILRPRVGERIAWEEKIMKNCAKATSAGMLATYEGQLKKVQEELNLQKEAENVRKGIKAYEVDKKGTAGVCTSVHVMEEIPPTEEYLVLDKAEGETFDRYLGRLSKNRALYRKPFQRVVIDSDTGKRLYSADFVLTPENAKKIPEIRQSLVKDLQSITKRRVHLERITELWIRESVFQGGFYHGDMHAGNLMANDRQATILDYGNATELNKGEVRLLMALYASAMYGDARLFLDVFLRCLPKEQLEELDGSTLKDEKVRFERMKEFTIQKNKLRKKLFSIFRRGTESQAGDKVDLALSELQKNGFQIPISLYSYVQSQMRLNNTLAELNALEIGIRNDIRRLDHIRPQEFGDVNVDLLMQAQMGANASQNPEEYYKSLVHALEDPDEKDFCTLLTDHTKDKDGQTAFEKKYMSTFDRINKLMNGKATYKGNGSLPSDYDDDTGETIQETKITPVPVIDLEGWEKDYENYLQLMKEDEEQTALEQKMKEQGQKVEKSPIHRQYSEAKWALQDKLSDVFSLPGGTMPNGLLEDFGNHFVFMGLVGDALNGNRQAFKEFIDLFKKDVIPLIELSRDIRAFIDSGKKTGAKALFDRYKKLAATISVRHKVIADIRLHISYDRRGYAEKPVNIEKQYFMIEEYDTTQFKQIYPEWRKLYLRQHLKEGKFTPEEEERMKKGLELTPEEEEKLKEPLTPEEEREMNRMWEVLQQCRMVGRLHLGLTDRLGYTKPQIEPWFMDEQGGKELYIAYTKFTNLRDADIKARDLKWDDDTYLEKRVEAERQFLDVYRRVGCRRVKEHMSAFILKVPPQKDTVLKNFNTIFEGVVRSASLFEKADRGSDIGISKATQFYQGEYVGGLDLEDYVPRKQGEKPHTIIRKSPWSLEEEEREEEKERKKQKKQKKKKGIINEEPQHEIYEEPEDEINDEDNPNLIITTSSKSNNEINEIIE